ncbi:kinase-like domain-containing protein [Mycena metata]|uniref:Kinase-like domain-containing protein n=1 Tax=Mycena metata TaxID=1033252 RepID=A0AAD7KIE4_9AGAR|nr:kinase-like domain-containing protein [Mycena metata]
MSWYSYLFLGAVEDEWELFSDRSTDYTVGAPIGFGASSIVYAAEYRPQSSPGKRIPCALKVLDLDSLPPHSLALLQRETTLMSLSKHPNVLRVRGSWMDGHKLHIALRLMNRGSAADVMRYGWPGGMEEDVVRCILQQALQGLNYLHVNGFIHRDVKAANLLIDDDGTVLLGDLGVAADLTEDTSRNPVSHLKKPKIITAEAALRSHHSGSSGSGKRILIETTSPSPRPRIRKRKSFVGTPCWMAPEVIQARHYDSSADIWSFGITALELTQGRPPRSRDAPQKVLLKTIQEAPPTLDREGGTYKYSRAFKEIVDSCLIKDPSKRPSAEALLQSPFFKASKKKSYLVGAILKDLPPLTHRQERRVAHRATVHGTVDSWDFATTLGSTRHALLEQLASDGFEVHPSENPVFEMEGERCSPKRRSNRFSWVEEPDPAPDDSGLAPESEPENPSSASASSSPSSPSDREFPDVPGSGSSMSSPISAAESPLIVTEQTEEAPFSLDEVIPLPPPFIPLASSKPMPVPKAHAVEPLAVPGPSSFASSSSSHSSRSPGTTMSSSVSSSRSTPGLWKKIKGLRRPASTRSFKNQDTVTAMPTGKPKS